MGLMVPYIADFERHLTRQFVLDGKIPFLHHGVTEIWRHLTKLQRRNREAVKDQ